VKWCHPIARLPCRGMPLSSFSISVILICSLSSQGTLSISFRQTGCSCDQCSTLLHPEHNLTYQSSSNPSVTKSFVQNSNVQCHVKGNNNSSCEGFCNTKCQAVPGFTHKGDGTRDVPKFGCEPVADEPQPLNLLQLRALRSLTQECPAAQPCSCTCVCKEIDYGVPMPAGGPPAPPAGNPYAPPPPPPKPPPQPFFGGPPPAAGVPFNPMMLVQTSAGDKQAPPAFGRWQNAGDDCPESAPCNCYCTCRPPVPSKSAVMR